MREITSSLSKHDHIDPTALKLAKQIADTVAEQARVATGPDTVDFQEVRRRRAQAHLGPPPPHPVESWAPLEQQAGRPLTEPTPHLTDEPPATEDQDLSISGQQSSAPRAWWRNVLAAVGFRLD
jgi:hypothetical protein